jgi:hypothetical protein
MWTGLNWQHVAIVARFGARFALRTGGGLVFLLLLVICGLSVAAAFITPVEEAVKSRDLQGAFQQQMGKKLDAGTAIVEAAKTDAVRDSVKWVSGGDDAQVAYLLDSNPALLSAIFLILLMLFPFLICYGGFNQTSGDIQNRGLRYLLLRTERVNIFIGRFMAAALFTFIYVAVVVALILLYLGLKMQIYDAGALLAWGLQGYVALVLLALPHLALCAWVSAFIDSPFGSLVLCQLIIGVPLGLLAALGAAVRVEFSTLARLLPWGWKYELLSGEVTPRLLAMGVMLVFTGFFLVIGLRTFHRRDL